MLWDEYTDSALGIVPLYPFDDGLIAAVEVVVTALVSAILSPAVKLHVTISIADNRNRAESMLRSQNEE
jgi:hypothetical protein